jgi:low affinity Fe/Cu permease
VTAFDRFAAACSSMVSRAWFFLACVLLVLLWAPSIIVLRSVDTWQLIINTATTIITFLMVALLQNSQQQDTNAIHYKLDAIAKALREVEGADADLLNEVPDAQRGIGAD